MHMDFIKDTPLLRWIEDNPRCMKSWTWASAEMGYPPLPYGVPWYMVRSEQMIDDWCFCRGISQTETFYMLKTKKKQPDFNYPILRVTGATKNGDVANINKLSITWSKRKTGPIAIEAHGMIIDANISFKNITLWWDTSFGHIQRDFDKDKYPMVNPFTDEYLHNPIDQIELRSMTSVSDIAWKFS